MAFLFCGMKTSILLCSSGIYVSPGFSSSLSLSMVHHLPLGTHFLFSLLPGHGHLLLPATSLIHGRTRGRRHLCLYIMTAWFSRRFRDDSSAIYCKVGQKKNKTNMGRRHPSLLFYPTKLVLQHFFLPVLRLSLGGGMASRQQAFGGSYRAILPSLPAVLCRDGRGVLALGNSCLMASSCSPYLLSFILLMVCHIL